MTGQREREARAQWREVLASAGLSLLASPKGDGTYSARVKCGNCGGPGSMGAERVDIPKGTAIRSLACPRCGCKSLRKDGWYP